MEIEDLKERYKVLPIWARLLTAVVVGLLPAVYVYLDEGDALAARLDEAKTAEGSARAKFENASKRKKNLPMLERDLVTAEEQLAKARKALPSDFNVEGILQKTATIAKEVGVRMQSFRPGAPQPGKGTYKYMEMAIKTAVEGKYSQVAAFYDRVAHLEGSVFMRNFQLDSRLPDADANGTAPHVGAGGGGKTLYDVAKENREKLFVGSQFEIIVYRAMTDKEINESDAAEAVGGNVPAAPGKGGGKKPVTGATPNGGFGPDQGDPAKPDDAKDAGNGKTQG